MKIFTVIISWFLSIIFSSVAAAMPTKIFFSSQANTSNGETYYVYQVKCDDGRHTTISSWNNNKQWCLCTL